MLASVIALFAGTLALALLTSDSEPDQVTSAPPALGGTSSELAPAGGTTGLPSTDPTRSSTDGTPASAAADSTDPSTTTKRRAKTTTTTADDRTTISVLADDGKRSEDRTLSEGFTVTDPDLQPKSVVASGAGLFFAQNMMYRHNVSVYDRAGDEVATVSDRVDLSKLGVDGGVVADGSPVEAAFTPDGRYAYVSNYKMYGDGYNPVADDDCDAGDWDDSFVYRIDTKSFEIDKAIPTGAVPKFMAVTPDGTKLVVSNWCGFDVSIIDVASNSELTRVDVGRHPRGIAITNDSASAYVTVMGEARIVRIDLNGYATADVPGAGNTPRHLVLSPDDRFLYVSNNLEGVVRKLDLQTGAEAGRVATGVQPRTMVLTPDGTALFVVNYQDGTVSKVRTSDMSVQQELYSGVHPVGITYDPDTRQVWVANYAGSLKVFVDR
ncbi:MAG: YncE family protein [Actinomycetota bacterium]|nr:YncE family protein [Actinomycetota bacterium]